MVGTSHGGSAGKTVEAVRRLIIAKGSSMAICPIHGTGFDHGCVDCENDSQLIWDTDNDRAPPCKIFDAYGTEWHRLTRLNVTTGEAEQIAHTVDCEGHIEYEQDENGDLLRIKVQIPTPITIKVEKPCKS